MIIELPKSEDTEALGAALWMALPQKCLLFLQGDLGAGKTSLVRGMLRAAGYTRAVKSPTFSLVEEYQIGSRWVFHFDLYRLKDPEELEWIGLMDYLQREAICCIEWPQMGAGYLPPATIELTLGYQETGRIAQITTVNDELKNSVVINWKNKDLLL